jgi:hypothetical protein
MRFEWREKTTSEGTGRKPVLLEAVLFGCVPSAAIPGEEDCFILGTLDERFLSVKEFDLQSFHFGLFWKEVNRNLDGLGLGPEIRSDLEREIAKKVGQPPADWALWPRQCSLACRLKTPPA